MPSAEIFNFFFPGKDWSTKISQWNGHSPDELTLQMPLSKCFCSLRSRRLEVVGTRKIGRARRRHACLPRAPPFSLSPTASKRLLRRLVLLVMLNCYGMPPYKTIACLCRMPRALGLLIFLITFISPIVCTLIGYLRSRDIQR